MDLQLFHDRESLCTQEHMPHCTATCPLHLDVRGMIEDLQKGDFSKAYTQFSRAVPFPGIVSRICDQPCRQACLRTGLDEGISINALERACVDYNAKPLPKRFLLPKKQKRVAIVGAGLTGLASAYWLSSKGYPVDVYDAAPSIGGRILAFSEETLPQQIIQNDFAAFSRLNVTFHLDSHIESIDELVASHDAVLLAPGRGGCRGLLAEDMLSAIDGTPAVDPITLETKREKVFAAGNCRTSGTPSFAQALGEAKIVMTSIDRFLQGASLIAARENEGKVETSLYTSLEGVATQACTPMAGDVYTKEEAIAEAKRCLDCKCDACVSHCEFLKQYGGNPKLLARQIFKNMSGVGGHRFNEQMNSCDLCQQCQSTCPNGFNMAEIAHAAREFLVNNGKMPPSAFDFALADLRYSESDAFSLVRHAPATEQSAYAFYPGCQLSGSAPWQVEKSYAFLQSKLQGGVGLILSCCGIQADWAGQRALFERMLAQTRAHWEALGKPIVITACPTCHMVFKRHLPDIPERFISTVLEETGLPEKVAVPKDAVFALHDSCTTRYESDIQESVRRIAQQLGCQIEEFASSKSRTQCCGFGGLMQISNKDLAHKVADRRVQESEKDFLVYCAMCRDNFSKQGKKSFHLLDLLFGNEDGNCVARPSPGYSLRHDNRELLKRRLLENVWHEQQEALNWLELRISPELAKVMEDTLVMESDVRDVIAFAERTGQKLQNKVNGHFIASHAPAHVTFWAEYSFEGNVAVVHDAWCHRLEIVGLASKR